MIKRAAFIVLGMVFAGCTKRPVPTAPVVQAPRVHSIYVQPLQGDTGGEVTQHLIQALRSVGIKLVDSKGGPDAVLSGNVNDYKSGRKLMVFLGNIRTVAAGQAITVSNPIVAMAGNQMLPQNAAMAMNPHIVAQSAALSLDARLTDVSSGNLIWATGFTYESLESQSARQAAVRVITQSLRKALPPK